MQPPSAAAAAKSSGLVLFEVNMISSPRAPRLRARSSSVSELQSKPKPRSRMISRIAGLGRALTAKYSRKPGMPEKAACTWRPVARMPASS